MNNVAGSIALISYVYRTVSQPLLAIRPHSRSPAFPDSHRGLATLPNLSESQGCRWTRTIDHRIKNQTPHHYVIFTPCILLAYESLVQHSSVAKCMNEKIHSPIGRSDALFCHPDDPSIQQSSEIVEGNL